MRHQRGKRLAWGLLSIWAALAMLMPSLLWACPMNGRIASKPELVCPCAARQAQSAAPESHSHQGCCHRIPLPQSDTSGDGQKGSPLRVGQHSFKVDPVILPDSGHVVYSPAILPESPQFSTAFTAQPLPTKSPPRFLALHFLSSLSGRAPPV